MISSETFQYIATDRSIEMEDFSGLLKDYSFTFKKQLPYFIVGNIPDKPEWVLELSVVRSQLSKLLSRVIPILYLENSVFRIVSDRYHARHLLDGNLGIQEVGRLISVYPIDQANALRLANILVRETKKFEGPAIPGSIHLGGAVFVCKNGLLTSKNWPFKELVHYPNEKDKTLFQLKYLRHSIISSKSKGNIEKGIRLLPFWKIDWCIIKQGKKGMLSNDSGKDMRDRMKWQRKVHDQMKGVISIPLVFDLFEEKGDYFLILEFIDGQSLNIQIPRLFNNRTWPYLEKNTQGLLLDYLLQIISLVERMHGNGFVHRDLTPANFIVDKNNKVFLIDMELVYSVKDKYPEPAFELGTFGYMSPEQLSVATPTFPEDIYGIGALIYAMLTCKNPIHINLEDLDLLEHNLLSELEDAGLAGLIINCLCPNPALRPDLNDIKTVIASRQQELKLKK